jgi:hypothetical protein
MLHKRSVPLLLPGSKPVPIDASEGRRKGSRWKAEFAGYCGSLREDRVTMREDARHGSGRWECAEGRTKEGTKQVRLNASERRQALREKSFCALVRDD